MKAALYFIIGALAFVAIVGILLIFSNYLNGVTGFAISAGKNPGGMAPANEALMNQLGLTMTVISVVIGIVTVVFTAVVYFGAQAQAKLSDLQLQYGESLLKFEEVRDHLIFQAHQIEERIEKIVSFYVSAYLSGMSGVSTAGMTDKRGERTEESFYVNDVADPLAVFAASFRLRETLWSLDTLGNCCYSAPSETVGAASALHLILVGQDRLLAKRAVGDAESRDLRIARAAASRRFRDDSGLLCDLLDKLPRAIGNKEADTLVREVIDFVDFLQFRRRILPECLRELGLLRTSLVFLLV